MTTVGLLANPMSGRDVRRLAARASTTTPEIKRDQVARAAIGAAAAGAKRLLVVKEPFRISESAVEHLGLGLEVEVLDIGAELRAIDTERAIARMREAGCGALLVLGGDGTNRVVARAWPDAGIIHLGRNPMDACFSMYKQVFTWAYKFSYSLEGLGRYYVAYDRLRNHWRELLQNRMIEVEYESLVTDSEGQTRFLLDRLGLEFEQACLDFDQNRTPSTTASSVQVREKVHSRSVNKWTRFARQLQPLKKHLENAGINVE